MAVGDLGQDVDEVGQRIDVDELARLDERSDDGPGFGAVVGSCEERVLAAFGSKLTIVENAKVSVLLQLLMVPATWLGIGVLLHTIEKSAALAELDLNRRPMNIMLPLSPPEMEALLAISLVRSRKATISEAENRLVACGFIMSTTSYVRITRADKIRLATERSLLGSLG